MKKTILLIFLLLVLSKVSFCQHTTLNGLIINGNSKEPISSVIILVKCSNDSILHTEPNEKGEFKFDSVPLGVCKIKIRSLLYKPLDTTLLITKGQNSHIFSLYLDTSNFMIEPCVPVHIPGIKDIAQKDIANNTIHILLPGCIFKADIYPKDTIFEKKYNVKYWSLEYSTLNDNEYNQIIFEYLDKKFGKDWRNEIRPDAVGLK
jgi:hypothetical protein